MIWKSGVEMAETFKDEKNSIDGLFSEIKYLIMDFTAIVNIDSFERLKMLIDSIVNNSIDVAISREFYESLDIVLNCRNEEQIRIAKEAQHFLESLKNHNKLKYLGKVCNSYEIVKNLKNNPNVAFLYYGSSEFAESVRLFGGGCVAKSIIVNFEGKFEVKENQAALLKVLCRDVDPCACDNNYFTVSFEPEEGAKVKTRDGRLITLTKFIGRGGEGAVYDTDYENDYVVKIYHKGQLNKLRLQKIMFLEKKQIRYDGICWPEKVVFSQKGEPVGFIMKKAEGKPLSSVFDGSIKVQRHFPKWQRQNLVKLSIDILSKIQYLHLFGIVIGDLRLKNIVINKKGQVCIVDIDSCQIENLPCPSGYPDYTPPELQHIEFRNILRSFNNERFSCAVIVFKLLFCGIHPYDQRRGADTLEEEIVLRSFPYPIDYNIGFDRIPIGDYIEMWQVLPAEFQKAFCNIFKYDMRFSTIELILLLREYQSFLEEYKYKLRNINRLSFKA